MTLVGGQPEGVGQMGRPWVRTVPSLIAIVMTALCVAGCGGQPATPKEVVQKFLDEVKAENFDGMLACEDKKQRDDVEQVRRQDPARFAGDSLKAHTAKLKRQFEKARIADATPVGNDAARFAVLVENVEMEVGMPGNILVMNQKFYVEKENGRWVIVNIEPAPVSR